MKYTILAGLFLAASTVVHAQGTPMPTPQGSALWNANRTQTNSGFLTEFNGSALTGVSSPSPAITLNSTTPPPTYQVIANPQSVVFDSSGNMYVASLNGGCSNSDSILYYSFLTLAVTGAGVSVPIPDAAIVDDGSSNAVNCPIGIAFDANGNLWVANGGSGGPNGGGDVAELAAGDIVNLKGATAITAAKVLLNDDVVDGLNSTSGLKFDGQGNLWAPQTIANGDNPVWQNLFCPGTAPCADPQKPFSSFISEFSSAQLASATSVPPTTVQPVLILVSPVFGPQQSDQFIVSLFDIGIDSANNLWVPACDLGNAEPDAFDSLFGFKSTTISSAPAAPTPGTRPTPFPVTTKFIIPPPDTTLGSVNIQIGVNTIASMDCPFTATFDSKKNLWYANGGSALKTAFGGMKDWSRPGSIMEFAQPLPSANGAPTPSSVVALNSQPKSITFGPSLPNPSSTPTSTPTSSVTNTPTPTGAPTSTTTPTGAPTSTTTPTGAPTSTTTPTGAPTSTTTPTGAPTSTAIPPVAPTPTAIPTPVVTVISSGNGSGKAGSTVAGGTFAISNDSSGTEMISSVTIGVTDPKVFSSLTLTATVGGTQSISGPVTPASSTIFTFSPPLSLPAGQSAHFALSIVISMNPAMNNQRGVQYAYASIIPTAGGKDENWGGLGPLLFGLGLIGVSLLGTSQQRRLRIAAFTSLALVIALGAAGCGGGGGGGAPAVKPSSIQTVQAVTVTLGGVAQSVGGLPAPLGKIKG
jgi:hypothetical protein